MIYSLHAISSSSLLKPSQALFAQLTSVRSIDFPRAPTGRNLSLTCFVPGQFFFGGEGGHFHISRFYSLSFWASFTVWENNSSGKQQAFTLFGQSTPNMSSDRQEVSTTQVCHFSRVRVRTFLVLVVSTGNQSSRGNHSFRALAHVQTNTCGLIRKTNHLFKSPSHDCWFVAQP